MSFGGSLTEFLASQDEDLTLWLLIMSTGAESDWFNHTRMTVIPDWLIFVCFPSCIFVFYPCTFHFISLSSCGSFLHTWDRALVTWTHWKANPGDAHTRFRTPGPHAPALALPR